jgi:hypothetical protein
MKKKARDRINIGHINEVIYHDKLGPWIKIKVRRNTWEIGGKPFKFQLVSWWESMESNQYFILRQGFSIFFEFFFFRPFYGGIRFFIQVGFAWSCFNMIMNQAENLINRLLENLKILLGNSLKSFYCLYLNIWNPNKPKITWKRLEFFFTQVSNYVRIEKCVRYNQNDVIRFVNKGQN